MAAWIFQWNPESFRVDAYLSQGNILRQEITGTVNQNQCRREIMVDDEVFIWRSNGGKPGTGGVVARAAVSGPVELNEDPEPSFWIDKTGAGARYRVRLRVREVRLSPAEGMILRSEAQADAGLADLRILRMTQGTNYSLSPAEAQRMRQLWESRAPHR